MEAALEQPSIYIVASQTGTILSRLIKRVTRARFNHVSISMDAQMDAMYSFGRRHPYNPVWGGYIKEYPLAGTFARFPETEAKILRVDVTEKQHADIRCYLERMYRNRKRYHYNYAGMQAYFWERSACIFRERTTTIARNLWAMCWCALVLCRRINLNPLWNRRRCWRISPAAR